MSSSVSLHVGNGVACRFYNHEGCNKGDECTYSHAADTDSIQNSLGQNVCLHFLKGYCRFGDYKCRYSHSRDHLALEDIDAISSTCEAPEKTVHEAASVSSDVPKTQSKKNGKKTSRGKVPATGENRYRRKFGSGIDWDIESEMEERMDNWGFTEDEVQELLCQGVKPWDDDARDVLNFLYDCY
ncbi:uncharacterized protein BT62DRAFT_1078113 [Guyanagaster necrorhizus]|uniref:C3H1-type domain-containing protein n=1 Tax=Guyanagaster necrorhizus TaxID=856835 RepID=A0A9P7VP60_9AGAR|nr:uncharacterized protein BT62DRAFT_1078113 [Guyanagaster necrorhizus MCA 3950]KAG7443925.1 hypothetical protein BT62DRAFT_1078113 [Guyanagaster necrorhizus MCA 3950]